MPSRQIYNRVPPIKRSTATTSARVAKSRALAHLYIIIAYIDKSFEPNEQRRDEQTRITRREQLDALSDAAAVDRRLN